MKKKTMIMIIGATLLLGGGGAGAFFFLMDPQPVDADAEAKAQAAAEAAEEAEADSPDHLPVYVELDPVPVPVTRNGRTHHYLYISLSVEVLNEERKADIYAVVPQLRHALLKVASATALANLNQRPDPGKPDIDLTAFAEQVKQEVNTLTGKRTALRVLVRQAIPGPA